MSVIETERLTLSEISIDDAPFILALLNEPSFVRFIGDKHVKDVDAAREYIRTGPRESYTRHGFGLYLVRLRSDGTPIGICGLLKRDNLQDADIGFAFLPAYWSCGYASESVRAVLEFATGVVKLRRVVAITLPENHRSRELLEKAGFMFERMMQLSNDDPKVMLYARELSAA